MISGNFLNGDSKIIFEDDVNKTNNSSRNVSLTMTTTNRVN